MTVDLSSIRTFRYVGFDVADGALSCHYALDDVWHFTERIEVDGGDWSLPGALEAARLVFLLAGVSYYKAAAPPVIDLGDTGVREGERDVLRTFFVEGLGEYAYANDLDLTGIRIVGGRPAGAPAEHRAPDGRPLIPFGGGIDSIVTVEDLRDAHPDAALFVLSRRGVRFEAIEDAAAVTGLPVLRANQELDPQILRSSELGFRNGHVPVTGVLSAVAVLVAVLHERGAVAMSNEWSASIGNVVVDGRSVNHQWSKSLAFEQAFRGVLAGAFVQPPEYFSHLRPSSELWIARRFAELDAYHRTFRSCNRAFHIDPAQRLDRWCGRCDKCCFIDLILSPYLTPQQLGTIFDGAEPLAQEDLAPRFRALLGTSPDVKPFECVGDVDECRVAAVLAADRDDRATTPLLHRLVEELGPDAEVARSAAPRLLRPLGDHHIPDAYASPRPLV
jgi:UDP-N-acetyl-alpha-D-muramoyl-L-alanyl-L-glutamate epimerase